MAQETFILKGKVVSQSNNLEGIHIINITEDKGVTSERGGYFEINVSENDTIIFSAIHLKGYMYIVTNEDIRKELLFIPMESLVNELDEITLTEYKSITTESLGIVPKGMKKYSPAERKLAAAEEFKWYSPLLIPVGGMSVDGLINGISGRTKQLKKELEVERKEIVLENVEADYSKEFLKERLKIPDENTDGFYYYIIEQPQFIRVYKSKNKTMTEFVLNELATRYLELLKNNKDD